MIIQPEYKPVSVGNRFLFKLWPIFACLFLLFLLLSHSVIAADTSNIFRTSNTTTFSQQLGVKAVPAYVVVGAARHPGLFIATKPTTELGRSMHLAPGMVLLTVDGYSMTTTQVADNWLKSRSNSASIKFSYTVSENGKPKICYAQAGIMMSSQPATFPGGAGAAASTRSSKAESTDELENHCLSLINQSRRAGGASTLSKDSSLSRLAQKYADYMADHAPQYEPSVARSPHIDLQGKSPADRARDAGISSPVFENIGRASRTGFGSDKLIISTLHQQMMAEPAGEMNHRSNIMDPAHTSVGIGIARAPDRLYLTEEFGN